MNSLRLATKTSLLAVLSLAMILAPLALTGCTSTQIQDTLTVAAEVANSAAAIVAPVSPEYGEYIGAVGKTLKDVSALYSAYEKAEAADRPGIVGKLHAALSTIAMNLSVIEADAHIKAPKLVQEIGVAVAIINSAVTLILAHLPASTATAARANAQSLPIIKAKSASDLANAWNQAVGVEHPEAVVTTPKHKRLGIF